MTDYYKLYLVSYTPTHQHYYYIDSIIIIIYTFTSYLYTYVHKYSTLLLPNATYCIIHYIPYVYLIHHIPYTYTLENTPLQKAFSVADDVLRQGVVGISEIIIRPGLINVDFADVRTIMGSAGTALMGIGRGSGKT